MRHDAHRSWQVDGDRKLRHVPARDAAANGPPRRRAGAFVLCLSSNHPFCTNPIIHIRVDYYKYNIQSTDTFLQMNALIACCKHSLQQCPSCRTHVCDNYELPTCTPAIHSHNTTHAPPTLHLNNAHCPQHSSYNKRAYVTRKYWSRAEGSRPIK